MKLTATFSTIAAVLSLATMVLSRPSSLSTPEHLARRRTCTVGNTYTEDFEDATLGLGLVSPLLSGNPTLNHIEYPGFVVTNGDGCSLLSPSGDQVLVNGIGNELLESTAAMQIDSSNKVSYFDLNSFYFGCDLLTKDVVNVAGLVPGLPVACIVTVKGYYQSRLIGQQQFSSSPAEGVKAAKMVPGKCHTGFQGVDRVEFTSDNPLLKAIVLDAVQYTPHHCT